MTTFTTEDRILAEKDGSYTLNVEGGTITIGFKDLTNNEIRDICSQYFTPKDCNIFTFARAILKKAQEK